MHLWAIPAGMHLCYIPIYIYKYIYKRFRWHALMNNFGRHASACNIYIHVLHIYIYIHAFSVHLCMWTCGSTMKMFYYITTKKLFSLTSTLRSYHLLAPSMRLPGDWVCFNISVREGGHPLSTGKGEGGDCGLLPLLPNCSLALFLSLSICLFDFSGPPKLQRCFFPPCASVVCRRMHELHRLDYYKHISEFLHTSAHLANNTLLVHDKIAYRNMHA